MTKAMFDVSQDAVKLYHNNDMVTVCVCLNEIQKQIESEDGGTYVAYEYDYNEFTVHTSEVDIDDVLNHPEKYMDYTVGEPMSDTERKIAELEKSNAMLMECLLEVSSVVYA